MVKPRSDIFLTIPLILSFFLFLAAPLFAQTGDSTTPLGITIEPQYPRPGDVVRLTITKDPLIALSESEITWYVNNKVAATGVNEVIFSTQTGSLGAVSHIEVKAVEPDGSTHRGTMTIVPTRIDLLMDSDSYTPPFYRGRALPAAETQLHLQAIVYFRRDDGSLVPPSSIIYTWRRDNMAIGSVSGKGRQSVVIPAPSLFDTDIIEVYATSLDNNFNSRTSMTISSEEPILALYEDHPLFGIMFHRAMGSNTSIPDSEMSFAAIPYFAQIKSPTDPRLRYDWKVNGAGVPISAVRPDGITVNADRTNGEAVIDLTLSHSTNFSMSPKGSWSVFFNTTGFTSNPFSNEF